MKRNNAGRKIAIDPRIRALLRNRRLLLIAAVVLLLIILISSSVNCSKRNKLEEEVAALEASIAEMQDENTRLRSQILAQNTTIEGMDQDQQKIIHVMDLFWQIDEAYVLSRNDRARELIRSLEAEALAPYLPSASTTNNGRFSPYDRYAEICEALGESYGSGVKAS